ncbi:hypothetical protein [Novosphingobium sp. Leaf2]|uniref:hypothetical protein n=1 Tax=Novosphingobium sp. Leaf2 TaxID=1735670 RepID=UPI0006F47DF5|nr:hypothetical protein [Novosphingobium sp. Leaf2]KQM18376.1 hypothetical protein ASE49_09195 [Novosphingobium sp. Leaf2]
MAVSTDNAFSGPYLANGVTTVFPFTFVAPSASEVGVQVNGVTVSPVLFDVVIAGAGGGSVTFQSAPSDGAFVIPFLNPSFTQDLEFENGSAWLAEPVNEGYDRSALRDQALKRDVERGLTVPMGESGFVLPDLDSRTGKALFFTNDGAASAVSIDDFAAPARAASANAALSAEIATQAGRLFPTIAAGLDATEDGGYFSVPQAGGANDYSILYRRQGAASIEINRYPSAVWVAQQLEFVKITLSPMQFGAVGDGVADDAIPLNDMAAAARALLTANGFASVEIAGGNKLYRTTQSLNFTGLQAWNLKVVNLYILGACTGKAVFDLIGTRGYTFDSVGVWGDKTNRPAVAFQAQRGTPGGFCDNASFKECFTDGWFSRAAVHDYGQETTQWDHCTIYNRDHTARVAIHEGYDAHAMTSDYATTMTGGTSFINKQFLNCDWRYLPADENIASITGISNAANAVITAPGHAFQIGDQAVFQYIAGMPTMPTVIGTVSARTSTTFTVNVDTTARGTFGGSGVAIRRATQSPIYIARTEGFAMRDCYIVAYGQPPIEVAFPDAGFQRIETFVLESILFEGAGQSSSVKFMSGASSKVLGFTLTTYNAHSFGSLLENPNAATVLSLYSPRIESVDPLFENPLANDPSRFAAYGCQITYNSLADVAPYDWAQFTGSIVSIFNGTYTVFGTFGLGSVVMDGTVTASAPAATTVRYMTVTVAGVPYKIKMESVA